MLQIIDVVVKKLSAAKDAKDGGVAMQVRDGALNLLFGLLDTCKPLALRREKNGRVAFMWVENAGKPEALFRWSK